VRFERWGSSGGRAPPHCLGQVIGAAAAGDGASETGSSRRSSRPLDPGENGTARACGIRCTRSMVGGTAPAHLRSRDAYLAGGTARLNT
jgi:hypothetical protein